MFALSKFKASADDKLDVTQNIKFFFHRIRNIVGKGEKCWVSAFSPFLTMVVSLVASEVVNDRWRFKFHCFPTKFSEVFILKVCKTQLWSLTLSQTTNFRPNWKSCRWQLKILWKWQQILQKGRKHFGKRRNCLIWAISPFPTMFLKD